MAQQDPRSLDTQSSFFCHRTAAHGWGATAQTAVLAISLSAAPTPDIRGIVPAQQYFIPSLNVLWLALGLGVLLGAIGWAVWRFLLRPGARPGRPPLTPREVAVQRLAELNRHADSLDPRLFGVEVSEVLRTYIGAQFALRPERQTSPEFLASIIHASAFSPAEKTLLGEFLEQADLLKFAQVDASAEARRSLLAQASEFVESTPAASVPEIGAVTP